jgi:hypothetical protein
VFRGIGEEEVRRPSRKRAFGARITAVSSLCLSLDASCACLGGEPIMQQLARAEDRDRWAVVPLALAAAGALGKAIHEGNGALAPRAIVYLSVGLALVLTAVVVPRLAALSAAGHRLTYVAASLVLMVGFAELATSPPGYTAIAYPPLTWFLGWLAVAALLVGGLLTQRPFLGWLHVPALVAVHVVLGLYVLKACPEPHIDVFYFQRDSSAALLHGQNPYALSFPNIYGDATPFYGPGMSVAGRTRFGFLYPPLSLFMVLPGHLLGDYRFALVAATALSALLMAYARPGGVGPIACAVFLFSPRIYFVLEQGWTEPLVVLLLSGVVFAGCRAPRLVPFVYGLFLASKQHMVLGVPLGIKLLRERGARPAVRLYGIALFLAAIVTLPLALWNIPAFWKDVVAFQVHQPFRADALSYLAYWASLGHAAPPVWIAFAVAALGVAVAAWRTPRSPAGFALGFVLVFFLFFAFNKQAFANYYFLVIGALCMTAAAVKT